MSVAITAGSRGIHDKPAVLRAAGDWLRSLGAEPFVVPAMGSHGGATAEGQVQLLADLGMTEQTLVGMPIRATMETVELDRLPGGPAVHLDAHAAKADGILAVNRVKAHTDFQGEVESGLAKIVAIGLGKQRGAEGIHRFGPANLGVWVPQVARRIVDTGKVLGGLAIVENAYDRAAGSTWSPPGRHRRPGRGGAAERGQAADGPDPVRDDRRRGDRRDGQEHLRLRDGHQRDRPDDDPRQREEFDRPGSPTSRSSTSPTPRTATPSASGWPTSSPSGSWRRSTCGPPTSTR
jgi:hypothetical protein